MTFAILVDSRRLSFKGLIIFFLFSSMVIQAQHQQSAVDYLSTYRDSTLQALLDISYPVKKKRKEHSLYIGMNWESSLLIQKGKILPFAGRYNMITQQVEMKINKQIFSLNTNQASAIFIGNHLMVPYRDITLPDGRTSATLEVLHKGEMQLLCYHSPKSKQESSVNLLTPTAGNDSGYRINTIYLVKQQEQIKPLKLQNQKALNELFGVHSTAISNFIKEKHLKKRKKEDLIKIIDFYNQMLLAQTNN